MNCYFLFLSISRAAEALAVEALATEALAAEALAKLAHESTYAMRSS